MEPKNSIQTDETKKKMEQKKNGTKKCSSLPPCLTCLVVLQKRFATFNNGPRLTRGKSGTAPREKFSVTPGALGEHQKFDATIAVQKLMKKKSSKYGFFDKNEATKKWWLQFSCLPFKTGG